MKAILAFNLPEEESGFKLATTALDWALTVFDLDNELRGLIKYETCPHKDAYSALEDIRDRLFDILEKRNLSLDMIE